MVRRSVLLEERFDPTFPKNQEWDLQLRLAKKGKFYGINEPLTKLNLLGDDEHIGGRGNIKNIASGYRRLLEKYKEDFTMHPNALARQSFLLAGLCREMGEFDEMRERMCVAWKARPLKFAYLSHYVLSLLGRSVYMLFFNALAKK